MAIDPNLRRVTMTYEGGKFTARYGLIKFLLGNIPLQWLQTTSGTSSSGRRIRKYGTKQRASAAGGEEVTLQLLDGTSWKVRVHGAMIDFIDYVLRSAIGAKVANVWTERGTIYGPQFPPFE